jgi:photosystem II stability/assembly factor-like uncharacterized protein
MKNVYLTLLFCLGNSMLFSQSLFSSYSSYSTSGGPITTAIADFNLDGKMDIATSNYFGVTVNVRLGNGDGTFGSSTTYTMSGNRLGSIAAADFNEDGYPDLVVGGYGYPIAVDYVFLLINNQSGSFGNPTTVYAAGSNPYTLDVGDMNNDGNLDIVTANYSSNTISVIPGNGNGTFSLPQRTKTQATPEGVIIRDFNKDGKSDLIVTSSGANQYGYFKGTGSAGTYTRIDWVNTGSGPGDVDAGDFNGDGNLDIAILSNSTSSIYVHLGNGNDTFYSHSTLTKTSYGRGIEVRDLNNDGKIDIAAGNEGSNTVSVFKGNGNNTFQTREDFTVNSGPHGLVSGDLNNDGRRDLITSNYGGGNGSTISILLNGGNYPVFSINASAGSNGSISPSGAVSVYKDSSKTFTITPSNGYVIDSVIVDGTMAGTSSTYTFTNVQANHSIRTVFKLANFMLSFNGSDERVNTGTPLVTGTGDFSISAWIYSTNPGSGGAIAGNYNYPNGLGGVEFYIWGGKLVSYISGYLQGGSISANTWYFVTQTRNNGTVRLYINGTEVASAYQPASIGATHNFTLGNHPTTNIEQFAGYMDEVRVYGRALTSTEINDLYADHGNQVSTTNLLLHYPMNEGTGLTTYNKAQNTANGAITRVSQWSTSTAPTSGGNGGGQSNPYPDFSANPSDLEFDSVLLHFNYTRELRIRNTGDDTLKIRGIYASDTAYIVSQDTFDVLPGDSALIEVMFYPHVAGSHSARLRFNHNGQIDSSIVELEGYGLPGNITLEHLEHLCGCKIRRASFFNPKIGWVVGEGGVVYGTTNGGLTWSLINTGTTEDINNVQLIGEAAFITGTNGLICVSYNGGQTWTPFTTNTNQTFYGVSFSNASYGFAVGGNGTLYRYVSGTWYPYSSGTSANFYSVYSIGNYAYAVGSGGSIYRFNGTSWVSQTTNTSATFYGCAFYSVNYGFAVGAGGIIYRTTNGGTTWTSLNTGTTSNIRSIKILNQNVCMAVCEDGSILQSFDGGNTWTRVFLGNYNILSIEVYGCTVILTSEEGTVFSFEINGCDETVNSWYQRMYCGTREHLRSGSFSSPTTGYIAGYGGTVLRTSNGGQNWFYSNTGFSEEINGIRQIGSYVYLCGANGLLCSSSNGGQSWTPIYTGTTNTFYSLSFANPNRGWAVGAGGTICYYNGSGWSSQNVNSGITFYKIHAIGNTAYAVGSNGTVCKYVNGAWTSVNPGVGNTFYAVHFTSENVGYVAGAGGIICRTRDGGATWTALNSGTTKDLKCIKTACPSEAIVAGDSGVVLTTSNLGATWTSRNLDRDININSIIWSEGTGYLVGENGNSFSFTFGGQHDDLSISPSSPVSFCPGTSVDITASGSSSYLWSTGDTARTITVTKPGTYEVKNGNGICADSAEVSVIYYNQPLVYNGNVTLKTQSQVDAFLSGTPSANCGNKWTKVNGSVTIDGGNYTDPITDLSNLNRLTEVTGTLLITNFNKTGNPTNLDDLALLKAVGCNLTITSSPKLLNVSLPELETTGCSFTVKDNANLVTIDVPLLKSVQGDRIDIQNNPKAEQISLSKQAASFNFTGRGSNVYVSNNGGTANGALKIYMRKITQIKGSLVFNNNDNSGVANFDSVFTGLTSISTNWANLTITNNDYLSKCCIAASATVAGGNRTISNNTGNCANITAVANDCGTLNKRSDLAKSSADDVLLNVFPNPNKGNFSIQITSSEQGYAQVKVLDLMGRVVFTENRELSGNLTLNVNLESFAAGQYIVKAEVNGHVFVKRVQVVK